jgi:hypothetical protein
MEEHTESRVISYAFPSFVTSEKWLKMSCTIKFNIMSQCDSFQYITQHSFTNCNPYLCNSRHISFLRHHIMYKLLFMTLNITPQFRFVNINLPNTIPHSAHSLPGAISQPFAPQCYWRARWPPWRHESITTAISTPVPTDLVSVS